MDGAILTGGRSSRMGADKALLPLGGVALALRVAGNMAAAGVCSRLFLAGGDQSRYGFLGLPVVPDVAGGQGPLSGINAALQAATEDWCAVAACDLPFLPPAFFALLAQVAAEGGADAIVPLVGGYRQTAAAAYAKSALPLLEEALGAGRLKMADLLSRLRVRYLTPSDLASCGDLAWIFCNVNTPDDLEQAENHLRAEAEEWRDVDR